MSDRGMKKWAPYRSLPEKDLADIKMKKNKVKPTRPLISSEEAEEINNLLLNHNNDALRFELFRNNEMITVIGTIKRIDEIEKVITLTNRNKIKLSEIISLKRENI